MSQTRQELIEQIIKDRKPFLNKIEIWQEQLRKLAQAIQDLEDLHVQIKHDGPPAMIEQLAGICLPEIQDEIDLLIHDLEKPKARFLRQRLNIGVIGRTGMGKSTLLQNLSGLDKKAIPTGSARFCTGVRSTIVHDPIQNPHAEITFYSVREFCHDVLALYYEKLELGDGPRNVDEFANKPVPALSKSFALEKAMREHLIKYQTYLGEYKPFLGSKMHSIPIPQVREWVAQDTEDGKGQFYKYMAVKEATIICNFKYTDVGSIALVDMPGLGDTGVGDEERLVHALGEYIDIALFILMPRSVRGGLQDVDFQLYDLAHRVLDNIEIEHWSFMILNQTKPGSPNGDNKANCDLAERDIKAGTAPTGDRPIRVARCVIADCSDPDDARTKVLDEVLNYLMQHMHRLDEMYMSIWQNKLADIQVKVAAEIDKAQLILDENMLEFIDDKKFESLFEQLWEQLASGLEDLLSKLKRESSETNNTIKKYFDDTVEKCKKDAGIPTSGDVKLHHSTTRSYPTTFSEYLHQIRTHLTNHFVDIDEQIQLTMDKAKSRMVDVFIDKGRLQVFASGKTPKEFLKIMAEQQRLSDHLQKTFRVFYEYELSLKGFFQSRIRNEEHLKNLLPDKTPYSYYQRSLDGLVSAFLPGIDGKTAELLVQSLKSLLKNASRSSSRDPRLIEALRSLVPGVDRKDIENLVDRMKDLVSDEVEKDPKPEDLVQALQDAHRDTVDKLNSKLQYFLTEPSTAALAISEEFVDQALFARDAKTNWRLFYQTYKSKIWDDFEKTDRWQQYQQEWQTGVKRAIEANLLDFLSFANPSLR